MNESRASVKRVNGIGERKRKILACGISPKILLGSSTEQMARSNECEQEMLVEGKVRFAILILKIFGAEPEGESLGYIPYVLAYLAAGERIAGRTGVVYAGELYSLVKCGGEKSGFSES